jgi:signal peptide peptidase SppA
MMKKILCQLYNKIKSRKTISIIKLSGVIGSSGGFRSSGLNLDEINQAIEEAFAPKNLAAVILKINSPGGSPVQSELISNKISRLAKKKNIKIYAFAEDVAASGGYWIACCADKIFAANNSIIGSIGVIAAGFGFEKAIEKLGIDRRIYTRGKTKSILDPFQPEKESDITILYKAQEAIYNNFKNEVLKTRIIEDKNLEEVFSGAFWAAIDAKNLGLIDDILNIEEFLEQEFGDNISIKKVNFKKSWLKSKISGALSMIFKAGFDSFDKYVIQSKFNMN